MKKIHTLAILVHFFLGCSQLVWTLKVPCGIFADQHRFEQMLEDQSTIEKASRLINELSGNNDALSVNQLSRWVATKEDHANAIQNNC